MAETYRRREKQHTYNLEHGITPATIKRGIMDIMGSVADRDSLTIDPRDPMAWKRGAGMRDRKDGRDLSVPFMGGNLRAVITDMERQMREAASNLEFEEAGRLRDEIKRLKETELFIADDPLARQADLRESVSASVKAGDAGVGAKPRNAFRGRRRKGP